MTSDPASPSPGRRVQWSIGRLMALIASMALGMAVAREFVHSISREVAERFLFDAVLIAGAAAVLMATVKLLGLLAHRAAPATTHRIKLLFSSEPRRSRPTRTLG